MGKKAFITGVAGFIGSHLADYLLDQGWEVHGMDNLLTGDRANINPKVIYHEGDIINKYELDYFVKNAGEIDCLFHLAAIARTLWTVDEPLLANEINITGTLNVLLAAKEAKVKKVVYASSNIVYAEDTPYRVTKLAGEGYMRAFDKLFDLPTLSLRFSNAYGSLRQSEKGPAINCIASLRKSKRENGYVWITGDGEQSRDFTHVLDIAEACFLAAQSPLRGTEVDICTGKNTTMNTIAKYFQCPIEYVPDRPGDVKHITQDPSRAEVLLGFTARRALEYNIQVYL